MIVYKIFANQRVRKIHSLRKTYKKNDCWRKLRAQMIIAGFPHSPKARYWLQQKALAFSN